MASAVLGPPVDADTQAPGALRAVRAPWQHQPCGSGLVQEVVAEEPLHVEVDVSCSLHLITQSGEIHLVMPSDAEPAEVLSTCTEGMRGGRVTEFSDCLPPGAVKRATIVVNFAQVSVAWVELSTG